MYQETDIITLILFSPKQILVIFHKKAKAKVPPKDKPLTNNYEIIDWKSNDRAVVAFLEYT